jgi:hypothetical protein
MNVIVGVRGLHDKAPWLAAIESAAQPSAFAGLELPVAASGWKNRIWVCGRFPSAQLKKLDRF